MHTCAGEAEERLDAWQRGRVVESWIHSPTSSKEAL